MDSFRKYLQGRGIPAQEVDHNVALAARYVRFRDVSRLECSRETAEEFIGSLVGEKADTLDNLRALARLGRHERDNELYVTVLQLLDGSEVIHNLYERLAQLVGKYFRDSLFQGVKLPTLGVGSREKGELMRQVIERLEQAVDRDLLVRLLSPSLRELPDEWYDGAKEQFEKSGSVDAYLVLLHEEFVLRLLGAKESGLFFNQVVTEPVIELVRNNPEMECGVRQGNIIYVSKIPYMASNYLQEQDSVKRRYYYCHCPWARESILSGETVPAVFCHCSAGFVKRRWEIIYGTTLRAEVLESVLQGDERCRFAIHLPTSG